MEFLRRGRVRPRERWDGREYGRAKLSANQLNFFQFEQGFGLVQLSFCQFEPNYGRIQVDFFQFESGFEPTQSNLAQLTSDQPCSIRIPISGKHRAVVL